MRRKKNSDHFEVVIIFEFYIVYFILLVFNDTIFKFSAKKGFLNLLKKNCRFQVLHN